MTPDTTIVRDDRNCKAVHYCVEPLYDSNSDAKYVVEMPTSTHTTDAFKVVYCSDKNCKGYVKDGVAMESQKKSSQRPFLRHPPPCVFLPFLRRRSRGSGMYIVEQARNDMENIRRSIKDIPAKVENTLDSLSCKKNCDVEREIWEVQVPSCSIEEKQDKMMGSNHRVTVVEQELPPQNYVSHSQAREATKYHIVKPIETPKEPPSIDVKKESGVSSNHRKYPVSVESEEPVHQTCYCGRKVTCINEEDSPGFYQPDMNVCCVRQRHKPLLNETNEYCKASSFNESKLSDRHKAHISNQYHPDDQKRSNHALMYSEPRQDHRDPIIVHPGCDEREVNDRSSSETTSYRNGTPLLNLQNQNEECDQQDQIPYWSPHQLARQHKQPKPKGSCQDSRRIYLPRPDLTRHSLSQSTPEPKAPYESTNSRQRTPRYQEHENHSIDNENQQPPIDSDSHRRNRHEPRESFRCSNHSNRLVVKYIESTPRGDTNREEMQASSRGNTYVCEASSPNQIVGVNPCGCDISTKTRSRFNQTCKVVHVKNDEASTSETPIAYSVISVNKNQGKYRSVTPTRWTVSRRPSTPRKHDVHIVNVGPAVEAKSQKWQVIGPIS